MQILCCYLLVLLAYTPGLWVIARSPTAARLPLVTFSFIGMFAFNAVGSIAVMGRSIPAKFRPTTTMPITSLLSIEYVAMLVLQAAIFYCIAGPYLRYRAAQPLDLLPAPRRLNLAERTFAWIFAGAMLVIIAAFFATGGQVLIFHLFAGNIDCGNILTYREFTYGRPDFWFYRLGFLVLPATLAAFILLKAQVVGRITWRDCGGIGCCLVPPLLLGEKSGILYLTATLLIAHGIKLGARGLSLRHMASLKVVGLLLLACVPTGIAYTAYYRPEREDTLKICGRFAFRVVGVYSESLAAVVPLVDTHGQLGGQSLPTIRGLLPHKRFDIEAAMHAFLWHGGLSEEDGGLPGNVPVSAAGEGYANFGWAGFMAFSALSHLAVIALQEFLLRLRMGLITGAISAWFAWLSMMIATTGIFSTLISLVHTGLIAAAALIWVIGSYIERRGQTRECPEVVQDRRRLAA